MTLKYWINGSFHSIRLPSMETMMNYCYYSITLERSILTKVFNLSQHISKTTFLTHWVWDIICNTSTSYCFIYLFILFNSPFSGRVVTTFAFHRWGPKFASLHVRLWWTNRSQGQVFLRLLPFSPPTDSIPQLSPLSSLSFPWSPVIVHQFLYTAPLFITGLNWGSSPHFTLGPAVSWNRVKIYYFISFYSRSHCGLGFTSLPFTQRARVRSTIGKISWFRFFPGFVLEDKEMCGNLGYIRSQLSFCHHNHLKPSLSVYGQRQSLTYVHDRR